MCVYVCDYSALDNGSHFEFSVYNTTPSLFRILHIILTLLFTFFVLRIVEKRLGWFKTCFVYILSGVGGNIVSAVFVPYYPEVGRLNRKLLYP